MMVLVLICDSTQPIVDNVITRRPPWKQPSPRSPPPPQQCSSLFTASRTNGRPLLKVLKCETPKKISNAFSTHPETPAPRPHFPQNPLGDIRADPSARASHRTQGRPCPTARLLGSGFEPASTGVPGFHAHHRHFTNRSATKASDAMFVKKKGHESLCPIIS
jgi:hypothetical protein